MSKSRPKRDTKSLSATPSLPQDNANAHRQSVANPDEQDSAATTLCSPSTSASPSTPTDEPKPDSDSSMTSAVQPKPPPTKKTSPASCQLISHLPRAEQEAMSVFSEIECNHYQYSTLGLSRELLESMTCDCQYDPAVDRPEDACGHDSDCINRLTQVECLPDDCRCRAACQNQRFQRKEYANIEIVQTEKKGFGLRAGTDIRKDTFVYEYVGDVVSHPSFQKRMRDYATEGIRHFYFMMLQKDEFIDATKRGGIGRFANHSCSPNCYVAKWTIGRHVRMGIFANRAIKKHEELTFNYNVDRYGHDPQPCYCGEPNCVGFIGGKTQTDLAGMDDLYLDALGISEEVERLGLKGTKKKKGKRLDDPDFMPILKPLILKDVPKVAQAVRQTQSRKVLFKLLTRIKITEDQAALRQIMRLRGFSLMTNILEDHDGDVEITIAALECMSTWPLLQRNKVDDSKVNVPVEACTKSDNETVKTLAQKLLDHWQTLESAYRIPKRAITESDEPIPTTTFEYDYTPPPDYGRNKRSRYLEPHFSLRPLGFAPKPIVPVQDWKESHYVVGAARLKAVEASRQSIAAIIAAATAAGTTAAATVSETSADASGGDASRKSSKSPKKHRTKEEKERIKEKRLTKLVGAVVVKCMSKHRHEMDHDVFKKHAKELTHIITEKEKKSTSYKEGKLDALSDEKVAKIKKFSKEYIQKILRKLDASGKRRRPPSTPTTQAATSTTMTTPDSPGGGFVNGGEDVAMTVDEAMDLNSDSEMGDDSDDDDRGQNDVHDEDPRQRSTDTYPRESPIISSALTDNSPPDIEKMSFLTSDPRRRRPSEDQDLSNGWEPHMNGHHSTIGLTAES